MRCLQRASILLLLLLPLSAQVPGLLGGSPSAATGSAVRDAFGRDTPRGSVLGFLEACRRGDLRAASSYLDTRGLNHIDREEAARDLSEVLDRGVGISLITMSGDPQGNLMDGLPADDELVGTVRSRKRVVDLMLHRVGGLWLFSEGTVALAPELADEGHPTWLEARLPDELKRPLWLGVELWQWGALAALLLLSWVLVQALGQLLLRLTAAIARLLGIHVSASAELLAPFRLVIAVLLFRAGLAALVIPLLPRTFLFAALTALFVAAVAWLLIRVIDFGFQQLSDRLLPERRGSARSVIPVVRRVLKATLVLAAALGILQLWGYDTTTLLAGVGLGGLAVALAAQKTLEQLFGGITLVTDGPVVVGDSCRFNDRTATVEDIGLRSTRLRTLERTVITVPNSTFSSGAIENFTVRDKFLFKHRLRVGRDAEPAQLRDLVLRLREALLARPIVDPAPARVRLVEITDYSYDLEIFAYVLTANYDEWAEAQESILLECVEIIRRYGLQLATPTQVTVTAPAQEPAMDADPKAASAGPSPAPPSPA